jgi:hypothetical protein
MAKRHKSYTEGELKVLFSLHRKFEPTELLTKWLNAPPYTLEGKENVQFLNLHKKIVSKVDYWNEDELELFFIGPLLEIFVDYNSEYFLVYSERNISAIVGETPLSVNADLMLAKGVDDILQIPYFCFHEYKRTKKNPSDPIAQVLEAMLIAQEMNKNGKPVYGAYVIGKDWYFMVMEGKEYCISESYSATNKQELLQIIAILREFRVILETTLID